jgi:hypothetical protein
MSAGQHAASRAGQAQHRRGEHGTALTTVLVLLVAMTGAGLYWTPKPTTKRHLAATASQLKSELLNAPPAVGTSGAAAPRPTDAGLAAFAIIREIETITGSIDGHELIGRRVDLHVPVVARAGAIGFWVGPRDNRVLVVTGDTALPSGDQRVRVAGIIKPLPPDAAARWQLTGADRGLLADRTVFILAN